MFVSLLVTVGLSCTRYPPFFISQIRLRKILMVTIYVCVFKANDSNTRLWGKLNLVSRWFNEAVCFGDIYKYSLSNLINYKVPMFLTLTVATPLLNKIIERFKELRKNVQIKWAIAKWLKWLWRSFFKLLISFIQKDLCRRS